MTFAIPAEAVNLYGKMKYRSILLFGAPGSGKGTQGKMIGQLPGFVHSSTGDLFRALDKKSEMGKIAAEYADKGLLVPDDFTVRLWIGQMEKLVAAGKFNRTTDMVVMDGIPRDVNQAKLLKDAVEVVKVIYLDAADLGKMVQRLKLRALKEGRADDADEAVIGNRMAVYAQETAPVLGYYDPALVVRVDADRSILRIFADIVATLVPAKEAREAAGEKALAK